MTIVGGFRVSMHCAAKHLSGTDLVVTTVVGGELIMRCAAKQQHYYDRSCVTTGQS